MESSFKQTNNQDNANRQQQNQTSSNQFADNRPEAIQRRKMQEIADKSPRANQFNHIQQMANNSPQVQQQKAIQKMADDSVVQKMSIRGTHTPSFVSWKTSNKHVVPSSAQEATAISNFTPSTFVTSEDVLTAAVDNDAHNFTERLGKKSDQYDLITNVVLSQYEKDKEGFGENKPVTQTVDNDIATCEIGVKKKGNEELEIMHFKAII